MASRRVSGMGLAVAFPAGVPPRKGDCEGLWLAPFCDAEPVADGKASVDVCAAAGKTDSPNAMNNATDDQSNRLLFSCIGLPLGWRIASKCLRQ